MMLPLLTHHKHTWYNLDTLSGGRKMRRHEDKRSFVVVTSIAPRPSRLIAMTRMLPSFRCEKNLARSRLWSEMKWKFKILLCKRRKPIILKMLWWSTMEDFSDKSNLPALNDALLYWKFAFTSQRNPLRFLIQNLCRRCFATVAMEDSSIKFFADSFQLNNCLQNPNCKIDLEQKRQRGSGANRDRIHYCITVLRPMPSGKWLKFIKVYDSPQLKMN